MMELAAPLSPQDRAAIAESFRKDALQLLESASIAKRNGSIEWMLSLCQAAERYLDLMDLFRNEHANQDHVSHQPI